MKVKKVKYDFDFNGRTYYKEASVIIEKKHGKNVFKINLNLGKTKVPQMLKELEMMRIMNKLGY